MSERKQALADAILALTWEEMRDLGKWLDQPLVREPFATAAAIHLWAEAHCAPTAEVIVEDEQPTGAG